MYLRIVAASFINHSHFPTNQGTNKTQFKSTCSRNYFSAFHTHSTIVDRNLSLYSTLSPRPSDAHLQLVYSVRCTPSFHLTEIQFIRMPLILPRIRQPKYASTESSTDVAALPITRRRMLCTDWKLKCLRCVCVWQFVVFFFSALILPFRS